MPSTLFASVTLLAAVHAFFRRLPDFPTPGSRRHRMRVARPARPAAAMPADTHQPAGHVALSRAKPMRPQHRHPVVRVLRAMEDGQPAAHAGRMVISGRMADVCAELDRMVAREAALRAGR